MKLENFRPRPVSENTATTIPAVALQGYVEQKITIFERIAYIGVIVLTITASKLFSVIGIALFVVLFGFRKMQAKKAAKAAA